MSLTKRTSFFYHCRLGNKKPKGGSLFTNYHEQSGQPWHLNDIHLVDCQTNLFDFSIILCHPQRKITLSHRFPNKYFCQSLKQSSSSFSIPLITVKVIVTSVTPCISGGHMKCSVKICKLQILWEKIVLLKLSGVRSCYFDKYFLDLRSSMCLSPSEKNREDKGNQSPLEQNTTDLSISGHKSYISLYPYF